MLAVPTPGRIEFHEDQRVPLDEAVDIVVVEDVHLRIWRLNQKLLATRSSASSLCSQKVLDLAWSI